MKRTLYLFIIASALLFSKSLLAQPTDLFISEYVEGSSFNKALELYNGTNLPIDLTNGQYQLEVYFNGSLSSTSVALTGTVPAGAVYIMAHPSAVLSITPDFTTTVVNFNGDDAVVLRKGGAGGPVLDVIGQVGFDPGTQWGANDTTTLDRTIRRKITVCQGDVTTSNPFYTAPEWDGFPQNTFNDLGSHTVSCGPAPGGLSLLPASLSFTSIPGIPSAPQGYVLTGTSLTTSVTITVSAPFELSLNAGGPFSASLLIPATSFTPGPVNIFARYSPTIAGNDATVAQHSSGSFSTSLNLTGISLSLTPIAQIQGAGNASPFNTQPIATEGIVTANFQGANELGGFFIQDPVGDNNPLTSEGIFISNTSYSVAVGDIVRLSGTVEEYFNRTQIKSVSALSVQGTGTLITPVSISLPMTTATDFEKVEGMHVLFTQTLTVSEVYVLARYGEVLLSSNGRLFTPTNFIDPNDQPASGTSSSGASNVAAVLAQQTLNNLNSIVLDDKSNVQNPPAVPYVDPVNNTLRCGSTLNSLDGIMDYAFSVYRIQPVITPAFNYAPRPAVPAVGNANVKISSFNVLNYFNGDGNGGGFPTSRGANTTVEFGRQRTKIITAIQQINADVLGLMEMENDGNTPQSAIADLVNGLNTAMGVGTYTFIADPANGGTGTDEIKVALIYKPSALTPVGASVADNNPVHNRPPLAQTFVHNATQEKFSVIVNHFKSKSCSGSTGSNTDQNDGQSCYNDTRKQQATALLTFITSIKTQSGDDDVLVMGDINAYEQEDPIDLLLAGGLNPLLSNAYSYVFDGQSGSLDHALVSASLLNQVSGADKWHINADEPIAKDYNQEFNPAYMYSADPFRSSDHDPVIIGLALGGTLTPTSIAAIESDLTAVSIFPNPATQHAVVNIQAKTAGEATIELHDGLGRRMFHSQAKLNYGATKIDLNLLGLNQGLYYVSITAEGFHQVQKLVIAP